MTGSLTETALSTPDLAEVRRLVLAGLRGFRAALSQDLGTKPVIYQNRMMKNVTISMEDKVARWVRVEAARRDLSVSRFLADLVRQQMLSERRYRQALHSALARKAFLMSGGRYLSREDLHERARVR